jgi:hypothetical protein
MDWIKKHVDTVLIMGSVVAASMWMSSSVSDLRMDMSNRFHEVDLRLGRIENVIVLKGLVARDYFSNLEEEKYGTDQKTR